jgi:endonuclease G, mitochondrial
MHLHRSFAAAAFALVVLVAPSAAQEKNRNIRFGAPKKIEPFDDPKREDFVITRDEYVLSYNGRKNIPNWVSWNLVKSDIGTASRGAFESDPALPKRFDRVVLDTYTGTGFDRGHMCPSKDRSATNEHNDATFYMTNIIPQAPDNNQKGWERLESYCRDLVKKGNTLHIVCGPHGVRGEGKFGRRDVIRRGKVEVTVPAKTWKVIMVIPKGKVIPTPNTRMIAVIMPNDQTVTDDWGKYRVSVNEVEKLTGYQLFPSVPAGVALAIKATVDDERIVQTPRPRPR